MSRISTLTGIGIAGLAILATLAGYNFLAGANTTAKQYVGDEQTHYTPIDSSVSGSKYELTSQDGGVTWALIRDGIELAKVQRDTSTPIKGEFKVTDSKSMPAGMRFALTPTNGPGAIFYICDCVQLSKRLSKVENELPLRWKGTTK